MEGLFLPSIGPHRGSVSRHRTWLPTFPSPLVGSFADAWPNLAQNLLHSRATICIRREASADQPPRGLIID
jgi:hypothetical protein